MLRGRWNSQKTARIYIDAAMQDRPSTQVSPSMALRFNDLAEATRQRLDIMRFTCRARSRASQHHLDSCSYLGRGLRSLRWSPRVAWRPCPVGPLRVVRWPRPPPLGPLCGTSPDC